MAHRDIARRRRNLERFHQRSAERRAAGLCLKCGKVPPAPDRTLCEPCLMKRRAADRARTARLRAEGKPSRDMERAREYERERSRRQHAERREAGICTKCGRSPARPERSLCEPCAERSRIRDRARHAEAKAQGIPYGGRDPETKRRADRERSRRRSEARRAAGICVRCGNAPPAEGRAMCEPCREDRRQAKRDRNAERRAAGLCVQCATPASGGTVYCGRCAAVREERRQRNPGRGWRPTADAMPSDAPGATAPSAASRRTGRPSANPAATPRAPATTPAAPLGSASSAKPPPWADRPTARPASLPRRSAATAKRNTPPGAPGTPNGGPGAAASSATRRRRGRRAASPVRASTARAPGRFAAFRSGTPPGR